MEYINSNKRIDVVVKYFYPVAAGIENNILQTYSNLIKDGWDVVVHTSRDTYDTKNSLDAEDVIKGITIKRYNWNKLAGFWPRINWNEERVVCLHNFNIFPHVLIMFFALVFKILKKKKFALFVIPHGGYSPEWRTFGKLAGVLKKAYHKSLAVFLINRTVDGIRTVSHWEKEEMIEAGINKNLIKVITNGLEDEAYSDVENLASNSIKEKVASLGNYIVQGGRIYEIKNQLCAIRALGKINSDLKFALVGPCQDKNYKEKLDNEIKKLGLEDRVVFLGVVRGVDKYYVLKKAKVMVHMAMWEGNCNFIHEAWSQSLITIAADSKGLNEQIKDHNNGFLLKEDDYTGLAERIKHVVNHPDSEKLNMMREKNMSYVHTHSWQEVAHAVGNYYNEKLCSDNKDKAKIKIAVVTEYFYPVVGGIENIILETYSRLAEKDYAITVHTCNKTYDKHNNLSVEEQFKGLNVKRYKSGRLGFWPRIDYQNIDIVSLYNFNIWPHFFVLFQVLILKIFRKKNFRLVLSPHGGFCADWESFAQPKRFIKKLYNYTLGMVLVNLTVDKIRVVSEWEKKELIKRHVNKSIIELIENGIEEEAFSDNREQISDSFKEKAHSYGKYIISVAVVKHSKNYETMIRALAELPEEIKYIIVGPIIENTYKEKLDKLIKEFGLGERIIFTGVLKGNEKYYLIKNAELMVHMSRWENYCQAVHEGLSQGKICLVANNTALGELVKNNENGFCIPNNDHNMLSSRIKYILNNKQMPSIVAMEERSRECESKNSWDKNACRMDKFYKDILAIIRPRNKEIKSLGVSGSGKVNVLGRLSSRKKQLITTALFSIFCLSILVLSMRGLPGNPDVGEFNSYDWKDNGPFELSPERGRYGLLYSMAENKSLFFSEELSRFIRPDVSINSEGQYVSMFAPGVSFLAWPGYAIGKYLGAAQVGAFATIVIFAFLNILLIRAIAMRLGAHRAAASIAGLIFAFATPAFAYAVTLYQHHVSTFIILSSIYIFIRWNSWRSLTLIWLLCGFSVIIDNPNFFLMMPVGLFALGKFLIIKKNQREWQIGLSAKRILSILIIIIPISLLAWYNISAHGSPWKIVGTLTGYKEIASQAEIQTATSTAALAIIEEGNNAGKFSRAVSFFNTRDLYSGFYTHIISRDRGILWYTPVILLGFWGVIFIYKRNYKIANVMSAVIAVNILIYSMWGDPYGGWAFGSRYLIPSYAMLALGIAFILNKYRRNIVVLLLFLLIFSYSTKINSLGAITSNANPPLIEIAKEKGEAVTDEDFNYKKNALYLEDKGSKSFVYRVIGKQIMSAEIYYYFIMSLIIFITLLFCVNLYGVQKIRRIRLREAINWRSWYERALAKWRHFAPPSRGDINLIRKEK